MILYPSELSQAIADNAKATRLVQNITQQELADKIDASVATVKRFEKNGSGSIELLCKIAFALGAEQEFEYLFKLKQPRSIDDLTRATATRKRARKSRSES